MFGSCGGEEGHGKQRRHYYLGRIEGSAPGVRKVVLDTPVVSE